MATVGPPIGLMEQNGHFSGTSVTFLLAAATLSAHASGAGRDQLRNQYS